MWPSDRSLPGSSCQTHWQDQDFKNTQGKACCGLSSVLTPPFPLLPPSHPFVSHQCMEGRSFRLRYCVLTGALYVLFVPSTHYQGYHMGTGRGPALTGHRGFQSFGTRCWAWLMVTQGALFHTVHPASLRPAWQAGMIESRVLGIIMSAAGAFHRLRGFLSTLTVVLGEEPFVGVVYVTRTVCCVESPCQRN